MSPKGEREEKPIWDNKRQSLDVISSKSGEKIAIIYFRESGRVAKLGRMIALWRLT